MKIFMGLKFMESGHASAEAPAACPECSAPSHTCETRYHECLSKEFTQAEYGKVHHLTVTAYMLQHSSKLTGEGWLLERQLLREFLLENKSPELVREQGKAAMDSGRRTFKITSSDGLPKIPPTAWTKNILDVRMDNAQEYCKDVTAWATAVLKDVENISLVKSESKKDS